MTLKYNPFRGLKKLDNNCADVHCLVTYRPVTNRLEEEMATHSSVLAWESHGPRSLMGYIRKVFELDMTNEQQVH